MFLIAVDTTPEARASLVGRLQEGARQADLSRLGVVDLDVHQIRSFDWDNALGCVIGSGCYENLEEIVELIRMGSPTVPIAALFSNDIYTAQGVLLRKRLGINVIVEGDLAQIASFVLDCGRNAGTPELFSGADGVFGFCQLKGGVGVTTLAVAFASCWARHGLSVAVIDLDDVNPQLSRWARVGPAQKSTIAELLRYGDAPPQRLNDLLCPIEGYEGRFVVVGQPESYNESFHFKSNVLEGVPSASEFITSLITNLKAEFDVVVLDLSRSWGVATFASLPLCERILLVTDDDGMSIRGTLDGLNRLKQESDDPEEFNLAKWSLVLNAYTGRLVSPKDLATEIHETDLFPEEATLYTVPFSDKGRVWGAPGTTLYDLSDERVKKEIIKVAHSLHPFKVEFQDSIGNKLRRKIHSWTHATQR